VEEYLTPQEVAKKLKLSERTVLKWLRRGTLAGRKIGNQWRVSAAALAEFLDGGGGGEPIPRGQAEPAEQQPSVFTAAEVVRLTGVNRKTLHYWVQEGFITPSVAGRYGTRQARLWSFADLVALRVMQRLREAGLDFHADRPVRLLVKRIQERAGLQNVSPDAYLVTDGRAVFETRTDDFPALLRSLGAGFCFAVPLGAVVAEVQALVALGEE